MGLISSLRSVFSRKRSAFVVLDPLEERSEDLGFPTEFARNMELIYKEDKRPVEEKPCPPDLV